ncbi:MAG: hypothetical protein WAX12_17305 [Candidatus Microthrix subdominans]|jgi:hypothetical protein|uniref:hypothetical protein n=1 Tax=Candidatus Neomicrothrix sp. TaxID=2719034 RepID=UPI0016B71B5D|nr:hypothetical protein [Candidatus Microthrix sp.]MBK6503689.1 hypothetical protein [Candidatus Microthrix sp.]MBK7019601.1 hypothetical protein [Candidatus Microthrix sp.]MBL0204676.1 hypothetical protein [Candidatus Microthrix sp.]NLH67817.1 hypothetical protein [Candidatus Microthrix parvicella]
MTVEPMVLGRVAELTAQIAELTAQRDMTVAEGVAAGARWADIGEALGVSAQAAHRRFRWVRWDPDSGTVWHEPPLG